MKRKIFSQLTLGALLLSLAPCAIAAPKTWTGAGDGVNWSSAGNWSPSAPATGDDVTIPVTAGNPTIQFTAGAGTVQINSLSLSQPLNVTGGVLQIATTLQTSKNLTLAGGALKGGTISATGGATLTMPINNGGTLDGVTLASDFTVLRNASLGVKNGLTLNNAKLIFSSDLSGYTQTAVFQGTQTLGGTGQVLFAGSSNINNIYAQGNGTAGGAAVLTVGTNVTVHGTQGGSLQNWYSFDSVVNQGTISADTAGQTITIAGPFTNQGPMSAPAGGLSLTGAWSSNSTITATSGGALNLGGGSNTWSNTGTIGATSSTVNLGGSFSVASLGTFNRTGGTVNLTGTLNNAAATLALTAATGSWVITGGTIVGGSITTTGGAALSVPVNNGGTLDGVTLGCDITVARNATLYVKNGLTLNSGRLVMSSDLSGYTQSIIFQGTQTLGGTGELL
ncbi:MAG: tandem-95 repeat protein, partial [Verrucomicrobiaceae bacterium]|nr:tandem-95 repeat protein [Verrucomicrobiaceae bacterium]